MVKTAYNKIADGRA